jgi:hypothetical protein
MKISIVRKPARLACVWVPTGNSRTLLLCVWSTVMISAASTANSTSTDEVGELRLCA